MEEVFHDLQTVESVTGNVDLELNHQKCELISHDPCSIGKMIVLFCLCVVNLEVATLLGSPIGKL